MNRYRVFDYFKIVLLDFSENLQFWFNKFVNQMFRYRPMMNEQISFNNSKNV